MTERWLEEHNAIYHPKPEPKKELPTMKNETVIHESIGGVEYHFGATPQGWVVWQETAEGEPVFLNQTPFPFLRDALDFVCELRLASAAGEDVFHLVNAIRADREYFNARYDYRLPYDGSAEDVL